MTRRSNLNFGLDFDPNSIVSVTRPVLRDCCRVGPGPGRVRAGVPGGGPAGTRVCPGRAPGIRPALSASCWQRKPGCEPPAALVQAGRGSPLPAYPRGGNRLVPRGSCPLRASSPGVSVHIYSPLQDSSGSTDGQSNANIRPSECDRLVGRRLSRRSTFGLPNVALTASETRSRCSPDVSAASIVPPSESIPSNTLVGGRGEAGPGAGRSHPCLVPAPACVPLGQPAPGRPRGEPRLSPPAASGDN